jgi:hypothetical protein
MACLRIRDGDGIDTTQTRYPWYPVLVPVSEIKKNYNFFGWRSNNSKFSLAAFGAACFWLAANQHAPEPRRTQVTNELLGARSRMHGHEFSES